jgi:6-phosphogluconolactonase
MGGTLTSMLAVVGCASPSGDIQLFNVDASQRRLQPMSKEQAGSPVSFVAVDPGGRTVYATHAHDDRLSAFAVDWPARRLRPLNDVRTGNALGAPGSGAAYATVDATGRFLLVASYHGHTVSVWRIEQDGRIGSAVQSCSAGRHAHCIRVDPSNRWAFATFLGSDLVAQYRFDAQTGLLAPNDPPFVPTAPAAGPRHIDFHPVEPWVFLINELDSTVYRYGLDRERGRLTEQQRVPAVPGDYQGRRWSADVHVAPGGRLLGASNRAHDTVALFTIGPDGGLETLGHYSTRGRTPRDFTFDPSGRLLLVANQDSNTVVVFAVDAVTTALEFLGSVDVAPSPYCVTVVARGD